jgi:hypothetical protein
VALAERWDELLRDLPDDWRLARLELTLEDPAEADRAAIIVGPATPGRTGPNFRLHVHGGNERLAPTPELVRRVLARLDEEGIAGRLELVKRETGAPEPERRTRPRTTPPSLAARWDELLERLPPDWSDLYAELELDSSDFLETAALLLAPVNPAHYGGPLTFRFRAARRAGYGAAPVMARRCLERLDEQRITGRLTPLRVLSDTRLVATQGPVWYMGGRSV